MPLKTNRKVAFTLAAKYASQWLRLDQLTLEANTPTEVHFETVDFPLPLVRQVFANGGGSLGIQYLVYSKTTLTADPIASIYRTRWTFEHYHKSIKQNASLETSSRKPLLCNLTICLPLYMLT